MDKIFDDIKKMIVGYVRETSLNLENGEEIPMDVSLLEAGIIDSYGVVELTDFIEKTWNIKIKDEEVTKENLGSVNKMIQFIIKKK